MKMTIVILINMMIVVYVMEAMQIRTVLVYVAVLQNMMNAVYVMVLEYQMENVTVMVMFLIGLEHVVAVQ